jgi:hypothetical protein
MVVMTHTICTRLVLGRTGRRLNRWPAKGEVQLRSLGDTRALASKVEQWCDTTQLNCTMLSAVQSFRLRTVTAFCSCSTSSDRL